MSETQELPETLRYGDWAQAVTEGRLLGQECGDCGNVEGTPKGACSACGSRALATVELPTTGEVYTETTIPMIAAVTNAMVAEEPSIRLLNVVTTRHDSDGTVVHPATVSMSP